MQATRSQPVAEVVVAESAGCGCSDSSVHQDQLKAVSDALLGQVFQHQLAGPVLVGRSWHDQRGHLEAGHVHRHDVFGAPGATVGATSVVEGEPAV